MANYLLLYGGGGMPEGEEQIAAVMAAWNAWFEQLGDAVVDGGNPTTPAAKQIAPDGSVSDIAATATGYSVISAGSLEDATAKAKGCPVLQGGASITILETFDAM